MKRIYTNRRTGRHIYSRVDIPKSKGDYLYFIRIGQTQFRLHKIGTTDDIMRRMKEHVSKTGYDEDIYILWISHKYSKYTTLRIEDRMKKWWIENTDWEYLRNDRFIIPESVKNIDITVRKVWHIPLED